MQIRGIRVKRFSRIEKPLQMLTLDAWTLGRLYIWIRGSGGGKYFCPFFVAFASFCGEDRAIRHRILQLPTSIYTYLHQKLWSYLLMGIPQSVPAWFLSASFRIFPHNFFLRFQRLQFPAAEASRTINPLIHSSINPRPCPTKLESTRPDST